MGVLVGLGNAAVGGASLIANKQEQKRNREYNLKLAQMQNQWNVEQWQRENDYNSPVNQLKRLKEAGLNPDLVYGGGIENTSATSPTMSSGAPSAPIDWSPMGNLVNSAVNARLDAQMKKAQIDNINADTRNKGYEGDILASDAATRDAMNQGQIKLTNMTINGISSEIAERDQNVTESRMRCIKLQREADNLILEGDKIRAMIDNLDAETASRKLHDALDTAAVKAKIEEMAASCHLSYAQAKSITEKAVWEIAGMQSNIEVNDATLRNINFSTDTIEFDLQQAKDWDDFERSLGSFTKVCNGLSMVTGAIGLVLGGKSPKPVKGFR